jgi:hypothetical protein
MSFNARAIATLGIGFGTIAIATLGFIAEPAQAEQPTGGGYATPYDYLRYKPTQQHKVLMEQQVERSIQEEDDIMLQLIVSAVTRELL